ncbi:Uncharacterised protein [Mycobacteroides abscessus subsp. abscessus]|nr:Uncharacterised protein [Mycobacteroides abscessus subsp. abscessus]
MPGTHAEQETARVGRLDAMKRRGYLVDRRSPDVHDAAGNREILRYRQ